VGDIDEGDPDLALESLELELHLLAELEVEGAERLIEEEHRRTVDEGPSEGDALLLAAGQLPRPALLVAAQANEGEHLARSTLLLGSAHFLLAQPVADVLGDVHVGEQGVVLEDRVDVAAVGRDAGNRLAGEQDLAGGRLFEPGDHPEGRRLAAAGRPEEAVEGATGDSKGHPVDGRDIAEDLCDVDDLDIRMAGFDAGGSGRGGAGRRGCCDGHAGTSKQVRRAHRIL